MRKYEVMYILQPTLSAEEQTAMVNRFNDLIASMGGSVTGIGTMTPAGTVMKLENTERFERRTLAYDLKGLPRRVLRHHLVRWRPDAGNRDGSPDETH